MFDTEFTVKLKVSVLVNNWFMRNSKINLDVEKMTDEQVVAAMEALTDDQKKSLIRLAIYEGRGGGQEEMANVSRNSMTLL